MKTRNRLTAVLLALMMIVSMLHVVAYAKGDSNKTVILLDPAGRGELAGSGNYRIGDDVTVTATPNEYFVFDGWYEDDAFVSGAEEYSFSIDRNVTLTARFKEKTAFSPVSVGNQKKVYLQNETITFSFSLISLALNNSQNDADLADSEYSKVTLTSGGAEIGTRIDKGTFEINTSELYFGKNDLTLRYPGDDNYGDAEVKYVIEVAERLNLKVLDFEPSSASLNEPYVISGKVVDENDEPVSGLTVRMFLDNGNGYGTGSGSVSTDENGIFSHTVLQYLPSEEGRYQVWITAHGGDVYYNLNYTNKILFTDSPVRTITFIVCNGWYEDDETAVKTLLAVDGEVITVDDIPVPTPDLGFGIGRWDTDPEGVTVDGDMTFTWEYFHYTITFNTGGIGTPPAPKKSVNSGTSASGSYDVEWFGDAANVAVLSGDDYYRMYEVEGQCWFTDPEDDSTAVGAYTKIEGDTELFCKWVKADSIVDSVDISVFPKAGDPYPTDHWYLVEDWPGEFSEQYVGTTGTDYVINAVNWEYIGEDEVFEEGRTYELRLGVSTGNPSTAKTFFKGHAHVISDDEWRITNPEVCYSLTVNGIQDNGMIDYVNPTESFITFMYTVPPASTEPEYGVKTASLGLGDDLTLIMKALFPDYVTAPKLRITDANGIVSYLESDLFDGTFFGFIYPGIYHQKMADVIEIELCDGDTVIESVPVKTYSVVEYADALYNMTAEDVGLLGYQKATLNRLLADLLVFGAAAQQYKNYNVDNPADSPEWVAGVKTEVMPEPVDVKAVLKSSSTDRFTGASLYIDNAIHVKVSFAATNAVRAEFEVDGTIYEVDAADWRAYGDQFIALSAPISASQIASIVTVTLYDEAGEALACIEYSVESYAASGAVGTDNTYFTDALVCYGRSALDYIMVMSE